MVNGECDGREAAARHPPWAGRGFRAYVSSKEDVVVQSAGDSDSEPRSSSAGDSLTAPL